MAHALTPEEQRRAKIQASDFFWNNIATWDNLPGVKSYHDFKDGHNLRGVGHAALDAVMWVPLVRGAVWVVKGGLTAKRP